MIINLLCSIYFRLGAILLTFLYYSNDAMVHGIVEVVGENYSQDNYLFVYNIVFIIIILLLLSYIFIYRKIKERNRISFEKELAHIARSAHVGLVNFELSKAYPVLYANQGFYEMIGYTKEQMEAFQGSMLSLIYSSDIKEFVKCIYVLSEEQSIQKEIRLISKTGNVIWTLLNGSYVTKKSGHKMISAVFVDITESKKMSERISLEQERYKVATEISNDILFEYKMDEDVMIYAEKFEELCGHNATIEGFSKLDLKHTKFIYPEDRGVFSEYIRALNSGEDFIESEFRLISVNGDYVWCHSKGKTIFNEEKRPIRVIGKISNIDLHKKELQKLEYKAKRDPLTGVYNKSVTKELINSFIKEYQEGNHIFMILDIDDFKGINDIYGHLKGDKILSFVIKKVNEIFHSGEILGRIGGDEFVVFLGNISDMNVINQKADLLKQALKTSYSDASCNISISGSIGISKYPQDGKNYNDLLMCADKAMYEVKGKGKDGYCLYGCK